MTLEYWLVSPDDIVLEVRFYTDDTPPEIPGSLASGKPRLLPVETTMEPVDPYTDILVGPTETIEPTRILRAYTSRPKETYEIEAMVEGKVSRLEVEYRRRNELPFEADVDGVVRVWHGDKEGMGNIEGINILIARNPALVPNPRPWKPYEDDLVMVSHDGFAEIGAAFGTRKDVNFVILQTLKGMVRALTNPTEIAAFDVLNGWE